MVLKVQKEILTPKPTIAPTAEQQTAAKESVFTKDGNPVYSAHGKPSAEPDTTTPEPPENSLPTSDESKQDGKRTIVEIYADKIGFKGSIDELLAELKAKQLSNVELTDEELQVIEFMEKDSKEQEKTENAPADSDNNQKEMEYQKLISSKDDTNYQKTYKVLDKYLTENDAKYKSLTTEEEKRKYIDNKIHELLKVLNPDANVRKNGTLNLSVEDRAKSFRDIWALCVAADTQNVNIDQISAKGFQFTTEFIDKYKESKTQAFADAVGLNDKNKSSDEILHNAMELLLKNDPKYKKLKGKEKEDYLKDKSIEFLSNILGLKIPKEALNDPNNKLLKDGAVALLREINKEGMTLESFAKSTPKQQAEILKTAIKNNPQMMEHLSDKQKKSMREYQARLAIISELDNDNPTENDIFKALLKKEKNNKLSADEKGLLDYYKNISQRKDCQSMLNAKAELSSFIGLACFTGKQPEEIRKLSLQSVNWDKAINSKDGDENLAKHIRLTGNDGTIEDLKATKDSFLEYAKSQGWSEAQIEKTWHKLCKRYNIAQVCGSVAAHHIVHGEAVNAKETINFGKNNAASSADVDNLKLQVTDSFKYFETKEQVFEFNDGLDDAFARSSALGMETYQSRETNTYVMNMLAKSENTSDNYKSTLTSSLIEYASPENQLYYGQEFSKIKDASITEGLAAAEKFVDASVKSQYSSYVDSAIKNNGYSQAEIDNINTARETGKTSYERNVESQTTTSAQAKSETKTSSQQQKTQSQTNVTNPSTAKTSSNNATVKLSAANTNSGQQMQQTLLKLQYDSAVAQKEKAMQDLQNIIDKIQNDQEVRAQKQAELKAKEAKTDEEVATAIKEAETKSADKQKADETKIVTESKSAVSELNEVVETNKVEEVAKKFNISIDDVKALKEAHRQGDLNTIYTKLGSISAEAQKKFVQFLSRKDTATIIGFIRNRATDKSLIKELCRLNPNLIKSLDPDLLLDCGIAKADIIKYAGASQLASMLASQARLGHTDILNQFYEALGYSEQQIASAKRVIPGSAEWESQMNNNMKNASGTTIASTRVRSGNFPEGQTRKKLRPQDYPDYKEYLA